MASLRQLSFLCLQLISRSRQCSTLNMSLTVQNRHIFRHLWLMPVSFHFRDCKSAAGHKSDSCKRRYNKCPDLYLYLYKLQIKLWGNFKFCIIPPCLGDRSFDVAGPRLWNKLPASLRSSDSLCQFRKQNLKTFLFVKDLAAVPRDSCFWSPDINTLTYLLTSK